MEEEIKIFVFLYRDCDRITEVKCTKSNQKISL